MPTRTRSTPCSTHQHSSARTPRHTAYLCWSASLFCMALAAFLAIEWYLDPIGSFPTGPFVMLLVALLSASHGYKEYRRSIIEQ